MSSSDACVPKVLTDFVFDLYDSVCTSQLPEEQSTLYLEDFVQLSSKYFTNQPWPSPQSIASECNGDPLFLAVYGEVTHRQWHAVSRPSLRDRVEGWQVYREFFEEILEADNDFYLLPSWCFDSLHEFVYQFQGFCQVRSAVYASARKQGLLNEDNTVNENYSSSSETTSIMNLKDNLHLLLNSKDAWDAESVFGYLYRLVQMGLPTGGDKGENKPPAKPVLSHLSIFASVALSRLECLLGDYTACLQALTPLTTYEGVVIPNGAVTSDDAIVTYGHVLNSVVGARLSLAYHAGVSFLMLRRYKDAINTLSETCSYLQRGFKTGLLRKLAGSDQFNKQYERMLSLLALLTHICPGSMGSLDEGVSKAIREKYGARLEAAASLEEFFQSPKFISTDPSVVGALRQQVQLFLKEMQAIPAGRTLQSYLKLYTSLSVDKLASFHDLATDDFLPLLLSYKARMRQLERNNTDPPTSSFIDGSYKTALDIHYYLENDMVHIDEAEKQRRFETYFLSQIHQNCEIRKEAVDVIDTTV